MLSDYCSRLSCRKSEGIVPEKVISFSKNFFTTTAQGKIAKSCSSHDNS